MVAKISVRNEENFQTSGNGNKLAKLSIDTLHREINEEYFKKKID